MPFILKMYPSYYIAQGHKLDIAGFVPRRAMLPFVAWFEMVSSVTLVFGGGREGGGGKGLT